MNASCHECGASLVRIEAEGRSAAACKRCRCVWAEPDDAPAELERGWIAASHAAPLACPGCGALELRLGSFGNRTLYRCETCRTYFARHAPVSAGAAAAALGWISADLLAGIFG